MTDRKVNTGSDCDRAAECDTEDRIRVLVAEDDIDQVLFMKRALGQDPRVCDCDTHVVEDGRGVVAHMKTAERPPHLIISDIMMPGISGAEAIGEILPWARHDLQIVFHSGGVPDAEVRELTGLLLRDPRVIGLVQKDDNPRAHSALVKLAVSARAGDEQTRAAALGELRHLTARACNQFMIPVPADFMPGYIQPADMVSRLNNASCAGDTVDAVSAYERAEEE